jgi:hypothetical protein
MAPKFDRATQRAMTQMQFSDALDDGDLYGHLGALPGVSAEDLLQAKRWHPDLNPDRRAQTWMAAINHPFGF